MEVADLTKEQLSTIRSTSNFREFCEKQSSIDECRMCKKCFLYNTHEYSECQRIYHEAKDESIVKNESPMFQVGDEVECCGAKGRVEYIFCDHIMLKDTITTMFPISVKFDGHTERACFTKDGRNQSWQKEPILKLTLRPKKKVRKTFYFATCEGSTKSIRASCNLVIDKSLLFNVMREERDRQFHEIEIEVEE